MQTASLCYIVFSFACFAVRAQKPIKKIWVKNPDSLLLPREALPTAPKLPEIPQHNSEDENKLIDYVETEATPNKKAWNFYLRNGLKLCLDSAVKKGLTAGAYAVQIKLLIDKDGTIKSAERVNDIGYGFCQCAETLLSKAPQWQPKYRIGRKVPATTIQKIKFDVPDQTD